MNEFDPLFRFFVENREIKQQLDLIVRLIGLLIVLVFIIIPPFILILVGLYGEIDKLRKDIYKKDTK